MSASACPSACRETAPICSHPAQAHPDFPRREYASFAHRFLLARVAQATAVPARKKIAAVVNRCDPSSAIPPIELDVAFEPGASATKVAFGPGDWNALPDISPFGRAETVRTVDQHESIVLGLDGDGAGKFIVPRPRELQSRLQQVLPVQLPNVEGLAAFADSAGHQCTRLA
jgi:hypothetical protein